ADNQPAWGAVNHVELPVVLDHLLATQQRVFFPAEGRELFPEEHHAVGREEKLGVFLREAYAEGSLSRVNLLQGGRWVEMPSRTPSSQLFPCYHGSPRIAELVIF